MGRVAEGGRASYGLNSLCCRMRQPQLAIFIAALTNMELNIDLLHVFYNVA